MSRPFSLTLALRRIALAPWFAALVGFAMGVLTNSFHSFIDNLTRDLFGIQPGTLSSLLTILIGVVAVVGVGLLAACFTPPPARFTPHLREGGGAAPKQKRGLILLVSNPKSAMFAIQHHFAGGPLEKVWLLYSRDSEEFAYFGKGTRPLALQIKADAEELARSSGRSLEIVLPEVGVSPADAQDTFDAVRRIFRSRSLPTGEIMADFTGGTKPMTVGLIMACMAPDRELEYVAWHPQLDNMHGPFVIDYQAAAFPGSL